LAARKARRGKRDKHEVQRFEFHLEAELLRLQAELHTGQYRPGPFHTHWISEPKPRLISAAPYRDRVVHHALMNVLEPLLERRFHPHSYACRKGKGTHAAADHLQHLMARCHYVLPCDIKKYFPSIDHATLKGDFRRVLKCPRTLALMDLIVDSSNEQEPVQDWFPGDDLLAVAARRRGLPIGNLTSQWFANWYLDGLDHLLTSHLGVGGYVRYCDDFVLLDNDRARLREAVGHTRTWLLGRRLRLHEARLHLRAVGAGLTFVGFRIWPTHRLLRKPRVRAFRRRVCWMKRAFAAGRLSWAGVQQRLNGWLGHARQADAEGLIRRLSREWVFGGGQADRVAGVAGRVLEQ
jgi:retron-type reverse transcriptase